MNDLFIQDQDLMRPGTTSNKSAPFNMRQGKTSQRFYQSGNLNSYRK